MTKIVNDVTELIGNAPIKDIHLYDIRIRDNFYLGGGGNVMDHGWLRLGHK